MDNIDKSHRDIINERLDKLKAERQLLEEEREKLIGQKKYSEYSGTVFYAFPQIQDILLLLKPGLAKANNLQEKLKKPRLSAMPNFLSAEGTACTFADVFLGARILKTFSCQTGVTLETISVNQVG